MDLECCGCRLEHDRSGGDLSNPDKWALLRLFLKVVDSEKYQDLFGVDDL